MKIGMKEIAATPPGGGLQPGIGPLQQTQGFEATLRQVQAVIQDLRGLVEYVFKMQTQQGGNIPASMEGGPKPQTGPKSMIINSKGDNMSDQLKPLLNKANKALENLQKEGYGETPIGQVIYSLPFTVDQIITMLGAYLARLK